MIITHGVQLYAGTRADVVRTAAKPFDKAIALFERRDDERYKVTFHFSDGSSITFRKEYQLEH